LNPLKKNIDYKKLTLNLFQATTDFSDKLIRWYETNKRELPWRNTRDPFRIWISEVILQQTRVEQGLKYYNAFISRFPDIHTLAKASEQDVIKIWQGMGYYSRARNIHATAREIIMKFDGHFPGDYGELLKLKGIGSYTASAISSLAFDLPFPVADGNVQRVISRLYGIKDPVNTSRVKNEIQQVLEILMDRSRPGLFNQAIMEFGALFCKPKNPDCAGCLFCAECKAFQAGKVSEIPDRGRHPKVYERYFNYLVLLSKEGHSRKLFLNKRTGSDIWKNMYDFPLIETKRMFATEEFFRSHPFIRLLGDADYSVIQISPELKHMLSHQRLHVRFFILEVRKFHPGGFLKISPEEIHEYPVPRLIERFLDQYGGIIDPEKEKYPELSERVSS
jgi:A/G-specific adenine glycosylase